MYAIDLLIDKTLKNEKVLKYLLIHNHIHFMKDNSMIVEFGCGGGTMIRTLANDYPLHSFYGYDNDLKAIGYASTHDKDNLFFCITIPSIPEADLIFLIDVFEHIDKVDQMLPELYQKLKGDGSLIIHVPLEKSGIYSIPFCRKIKSLNSGHVNFYTYEEVKEILERNGFKVEETFFHYHFISGLRDFLKYYLFSNTPNIAKEIIYTRQWNTFGYKFVFKVLDRLAYYESIFLKDIKFGASGVTIKAVKK